MTPATDNETPAPLFVCAVEDKAMILCERHAKVFELSLIMAQAAHTIYELDDEDAADSQCQACNLTDELTRPRLILPN